MMIKMRIKIISLNLLLMFLLISGSSSADLVNGSSGYAPDNIEQGSKVRFYGTIHNAEPSEIYVYRLNVSFVEQLASDSSARSDSYNYSKSYIADPERLDSNHTFTDYVWETVDIPASKYNISIFFLYSNVSGAASNRWNEAYTLGNYSVSVLGVTEPLKVVYGLIIFFGTSAGIFILLVLRNRFKK